MASADPAMLLPTMAAMNAGARDRRVKVVVDGASSQADSVAAAIDGAAETRGARPAEAAAGLNALAEHQQRAAHRPCVGSGIGIRLVSQGRGGT